MLLSALKRLDDHKAAERGDAPLEALPPRPGGAVDTGTKSTHYAVAGSIITSTTASVQPVSDNPNVMCQASNHGLSASTVDSCIQLFAKLFAEVVAVLPTWYQLIHDQGGYSGSLLNNLNMAMLKDGGKTLMTIIWPFLIVNHFVLCLIRPNYTATVLNSLGATGVYLDVIKKVLATTTWNE